MQPTEVIPRISWVTGIVHDGDAISETILAELAALDQLCRSERVNIDAKVYCCAASAPDVRIEVLSDWRTMLADPHFQTSDIYIFHFGVYNEVHHAMNFVRRDATVIVWYHNITPPQYAPAAAEDLAHRCFQQIENFKVADQVLVNSAYTAGELQRLGLALQVEVMPLFGPNANALAAAGAKDLAARSVEPARILYCGRFVESKSVHTLLEALAIFAADDPRPVQLTLAGLRDYSSPTYIEQLQALARALPTQIVVRFAFDSDSQALKGLFAACDFFVMPSLHEGFGMPVIEAFAADVPVISTRCGALAEVCAGLALHFEARQSTDLAEKLKLLLAALDAGEVLCEQGAVPRAAWTAQAQARAQIYSRTAYIKRYQHKLKSWLQARPALSKSRKEALSKLHHDGGLYEPSAPASDPFDAAIRSAVLGHEVVSRLQADASSGLTALLQWPFPGVHQSQADLAYWHSVLAKKGVRGVMQHLGNSPEIRGDRHRLQMGVFLSSAVNAVSAQLGTAATEAESAKRIGMLHHRVRLLAQSSNADAEFVREAYRLILQREPEEGGLGAFFNALRSGDMTREDVLRDILSSEEVKLR